jgi:hypothetical protein
MCTEFTAPAPSRERLPNRRPALTIDLLVGPRSYAATIGFDRHGAPKEIFLAGAREGSDMQAVLDDTAITISLALQHGISARALAAALSRISSGGAASIIGAAADLLSQYEGALS